MCMYAIDWIGIFNLKQFDGWCCKLFLYKGGGGRKIKKKRRYKLKEQEWELINNLYSRVKKIKKRSRKLRVKAS